MLKWLLLMALGWIVYRIVVPRSRDHGRQGEGSIEMLKCAECGVLFPETDGIRGSEANFCCAGHRDTWLSNR